MHNTCSTTSMPNHLTVASRTTESWPFEFREISTFREVWTVVIAFLEGNSEIGLFQAVEQVPYYHQQSSNHQFWARRESGGGDRPRNVQLWAINIDIRRSFNSRDSFPRRKFKNLAPASCSPGPILSPSTISFELHAKTVEEIDLEKCNFCNVGSYMTLILTLDRVEVTLVRISGRGLPRYQIRWKSEKNILRTCVRTKFELTDRRTHRSSNLLGHRLAMT